AKTVQATNRSVKMPMGMRASDPSRTGTATRTAVSVAERCSCCRKRGAKAPMRPQQAKQMANERVPSESCSLADGRKSEGITGSALLENVSMCPSARDGGDGGKKRCRSFVDS